MQTERAAYNGNKKKIQEAVANLKPGDYLRLRKLTPRESLRLMDIEDKFIDRMLASGNEESEIYRQSGNSIVIGPMYHIFRRLFVDRIEPDEGQSYSLY